MRVVKYNWKDNDYYFCFTNNALVATLHEWPNTSNVLDLIPLDGERTTANLCRLAVILSEAGEMARRYYGYDQSETLTYEQLEELTYIGLPVDILALRKAVTRAIALGYTREVESDESEEIDLILLELQKKTNPTK